MNATPPFERLTLGRALLDTMDLPPVKVGDLVDLDFDRFAIKGDTAGGTLTLERVA